MAEMAKPPRVPIALSKIPSSKKKLERRLADLDNTHAKLGQDWYGDAARIEASINATIDDVFGRESADAYDFYIDSQWFIAQYALHDHQYVAQFAKGLERARVIIGDAVKRLEEKASDAEDDDTAATIRAYDGLDLHPEIARAASELYRDGHYANAVLDAVKALNAFVRLRSGIEDRDGTDLMEYVFSVKNPVLVFNDLKDESDRNEQKGFMMMFSGAVAGLRNPRAHRLVKDDPERALEFIAYVSLLAKLVDEAKRFPMP